MSDQKKPVDLSTASDEEINRRKQKLIEHYTECGNKPVGLCKKHGGFKS